MKQKTIHSKHNKMFSLLQDGEKTHTRAHTRTRTATTTGERDERRKGKKKKNLIDVALDSVLDEFNMVFPLKRLLLLSDDLYLR